MLDKIKEFFTIDREVADKQKSILLLTTLFSVLGVGGVAVLDATGMINENTTPEDTVVDSSYNV